MCPKKALYRAFPATLMTLAWILRTSRAPISLRSTQIWSRKVSASAQTVEYVWTAPLPNVGVHTYLVTLPSLGPVRAATNALAQKHLDIAVANGHVLAHGRLLAGDPARYPIHEVTKARRRLICASQTSDKAVDGTWLLVRGQNEADVIRKLASDAFDGHDLEQAVVRAVEVSQ